MKGYCQKSGNKSSCLCDIGYKGKSCSETQNSLSLSLVNEITFNVSQKVSPILQYK